MSEKTYTIPVHVFIKATSPEDAYKQLCALFPSHIGWESGDEWYIDGEDAPMSEEEVDAARNPPCGEEEDGDDV